MRTLVVFVKQPTPGRVKTRLAAAIGPERAADLYAAFTSDLLDRMRAVADRRVLYFAPDEAAARSHFAELAGGDFELVAQPDVSLGERLEACFGAATGPDRQGGEDAVIGPDRIVAIGSDSPLLPLSYIDHAFALLAERDCVLGPATDGGYFLVGLRRGARSIFEDIDWSGPRVLGQTVDRVVAAGLSLGLLPPWYDVDEFDDLRMLDGHLRAMRAAGEAVDTPALERLLVDLRIDELST